jgi:predicted transcriptional regulator
MEVWHVGRSRYRPDGQIVSDHIANNAVAVQKLPAFIREVHQALATVGQAVAGPIKPEPAVAARKSVFADHILCLDCGGRFKLLKGHIAAHHQMTPDQYRIKWALPRSYPLVAPAYAAARSKLAKDNGLGRKVAAPQPSKTRGRPKSAKTTSS